MRKINSGLVTDLLRNFHHLICCYKIRFKNAYATTILLVGALRQLLRGIHLNTRAIYLKQGAEEKREYFSKTRDQRTGTLRFCYCQEISVIKAVSCAVQKKEHIVTTSLKINGLSFYRRVRKIAKSDY
jgi:hypothetical protein